MYVETLFSVTPKPSEKVVYFWTVISMKRRADMVMFNGIMGTEFYVRILIKALVPSAQRIYLGSTCSYLFMQDNDPL